jgi:hypothetical protein
MSIANMPNSAGRLMGRGSMYRIEDECEYIERVRLSRTENAGCLFAEKGRCCEWADNYPMVLLQSS